MLLRREAVAQRFRGSGGRRAERGALGWFRAWSAGRGSAGALSGPCCGYLVAVELGQVVRHHQ